jgi:hypothetical protein
MKRVGLSANENRFLRVAATGNGGGFFVYNKDYMKTYNTAMKAALKLVIKLTKIAKNNPESFCENFGQEEVRQFIDKLQLTELPYNEKSKIETMLYAEVSKITPH